MQKFATWAKAPKSRVNDEGTIEWKVQLRASVLDAYTAGAKTKAEKALMAKFQKAGTTTIAWVEVQELPTYLALTERIGRPKGAPSTFDPVRLARMIEAVAKAAEAAA